MQVGEVIHKMLQSTFMITIGDIIIGIITGMVIIGDTITGVIIIGMDQVGVLAGIVGMDQIGVGD
jgi:hypothetical protein